MKRTTIKKTLGVTLVALATLAVMTLVFWSRISQAFGPMEQNELQCLICHRQRVEKWVCGSKVRDDIITNKYSDWIDSFTPVAHQHVWFTLIQGQQCNYLGYAVATAAALTATVTKYIAKGYRYHGRRKPRDFSRSPEASCLYECDRGGFRS